VKDKKKHETDSDSSDDPKAKGVYKAPKLTAVAYDDKSAKKIS